MRLRSFETVLTGTHALDYLASRGGRACLYPGALGPARADLTLAEAREVCDADPDLLWVPALVDWRVDAPLVVGRGLSVDVVAGAPARIERFAAVAGGIDRPDAILATIDRVLGAWISLPDPLPPLYGVAPVVLLGRQPTHLARVASADGVRVRGVEVVDEGGPTVDVYTLDDVRAGSAPSWTGRASRSPDAEPIYQVWPCDGLPEGAWVRLEALDDVDP